MFKHLRLKRPLAVLDVETTGTRPAVDRVVEIAVVRYPPAGRPVGYSRRVNPGVPIPPAASAVHGITDADVDDCRPFAKIARKVARFLDGCDLCGFNIKRFDLPFLAAEFLRAGVHLSLNGRSVIDVLQIYHEHERRDLRAAFAFYCGGNHEQAHRPGRDARVTAAILDAQLRRYRELPRTVAELHRSLAGVDVGGWFRRDGGEVVFTMGKHSGRSLREVARMEPGYLRWMLGQALLEDTRALVEAALAGYSDA